MFSDEDFLVLLTKVGTFDHVGSDKPKERGWDKGEPSSVPLYGTH